MCVRWYLLYKLSLHDLVERMAERGLQLAHTTILRWVSRYVPEFIKRWNRFDRGSGRSWRVDETYIKVRGRWVYVYRAVDDGGNTVDFRLGKEFREGRIPRLSQAWAFWLEAESWFGGAVRFSKSALVSISPPRSRGAVGLGRGYFSNCPSSQCLWVTRLLRGGHAIRAHS